MWRRITSGKQALVKALTQVSADPFSGQNSVWFTCCFATWPRTFLASDFNHILEVKTLTESLYLNAPLARLSGSARGNILASLARSVVSDLHPREVVRDPASGVCIDGSSRGWNRAEYDWLWDGLHPREQLQDPIVGACVDGRSRGWNRAEYDWLWKGRRVECKSAQLSWDINKKRWRFEFVGVKLALDGVRSEALFDELLLILYSPERIYIYRHDLRLGLAKAGNRTSCVGHSIRITGPRNERDWQIAFAQILSKLDSQSNDCTRLADISLQDARVRGAVSHHAQSVHVTKSAYADIPLSNRTGTVRGARIQTLVRTIDGIIHPDQRIDDPSIGICIDGSRRSKGNAEYDWNRGSQRIECKSAQLLWVPSTRRWGLVFRGVKLDAFDVLLLALYTPSGMYLYRHDLNLGFSATGTSRLAIGRHIQLRGPAWENDHAVALSHIFQKLDRSGCERLAVVEWR